MKTSRFIGRALIAGLRRGADARVTQAVLSILGLVGFTLIGSPLWSQEFVWQGCTLLMLAIAAAIGSGSYVLYRDEVATVSHERDEAIRVAGENAVHILSLEDELESYRAEPRSVDGALDLDVPKSYRKVGIQLENSQGATVDGNIFGNGYDHAIVDSNGTENSYKNNEFGR
ncbi:hypothetical protein [Rhodococcoides fascians]|uniref:hypothetical protein n=1 Tax=Rhodococcoides fascians TaxID=1828 RepID=UPI0037B80B61